MQNRFLKRSGLLVNLIMAFVLVSLALVGIVKWGDVRGLVVMTALLVLTAILSLVVFSAFAVWLPVTPQVFVLMGGTISLMLIRHRSERRRVMVLEAEQRRLESELRERELKLQMLEREFITDRESVGNVNLLEEIKRSKREVRELSARVADFTKAEHVEPLNAGEEMPFEGIVHDPSGKIAPTDSAVMITGESGTGKELIARAIHHRSKRKSGPFVAINCAAIPESLLESELFGHVKGAFTGAVGDKQGLIETADGGTVFFDEIAETSDAFQAKLLRTLQSGEIQRIGSTGIRTVDTRILAATNKNIEDLLEKGRFREDLYFRLKVFTIQIPALRERKTDIPFLVWHFLNEEGPGLSISSTASDIFLRYDWPGNVRELQSAIKRGAILAQADKRSLIQLKDLPPEISEQLVDRVDLEDQILESLRERGFSRSSISETAEALGGLNRGTVAEYFRGTCFKTFFEKSWDVDKTVALLAGSEEPEVHDRVRKKVLEYLRNLVEDFPSEGSPEEFETLLRPKTKNLPQRYHVVLEEVVRAYLRGKWKL
jgi:transcriptional regulator with GAF, ATPase, and Fis domain